MHRDSDPKERRGQGARKGLLSLLLCFFALWRWILCGSALAGILAACSKAPLSEIEGATMGTMWHLKFPAKRDSPGLRVALQARLDEIDSAITNWRESPVTRFNRSTSTGWTAVPRELAVMVQFSQRLSAETHGAFDITVAPLVDLWGFGAKGHIQTPPADTAIIAAMQHVGWQKLEVRTEPPALRKSDPLLQINVSAMADGYAVDDLSKILRRAGVKNFLLEIGGAVRAEGVNESGKPWLVGIQQPFAAQGESTSAIPLQNQSLSTSGGYRQYFEAGDRRYAHVLDARTGRPVEHRLVSVSVMNESCFAADGWDTALLILGPKEGRTLAAEKKIDALFLEEAAR